MKKLLAFAFIFIFLCAFIFNVSVFASDSEREMIIEPVKEKPEFRRYLDGRWWTDVKSYNSYILANYRYEAKSGLSSVAGTEWLLNTFVYDTSLDFDDRAEFSFNGFVDITPIIGYRLTGFGADSDYEVLLMFRVPNGNSNYLDRAYDPEDYGGWEDNADRYLAVTSYNSASTYNTRTEAEFISFLQTNAVRVNVPNVAYITASNGSFVISDGTNTSSSSPFQFTTNSITLTLTPSSGYTLPSSITVVGGTAVETTSGVWSITGIVGDVDISVSFPAQVVSYSVSSGSVSGGTVSFSSNTVVSGGSVTVTTVPSTGYDQPLTSDFTIAGTYGSLTGSNGSYSISNIASNITVSVSFPASSPVPTYATIYYNLIDCSTSALTSALTGSNVSGTIVPASGYTYPTTLSAQSAGLPVQVSYNSSTGVFTLYNVQGEVYVYATAVQVSGGSNTVSYSLSHCTCSISFDSYNSGTTISFTLTPDVGYLMSDADTKVSFDGFVSSNYAPPNSYAFSYNEVSAQGDLVIVGVAKPWYDLVGPGSGSGYNNYLGSYQDGYNTGFIDGQISVSSDSSVSSGLDRYNAIYSDAFRSGIYSVSRDSDNERGRDRFNQIYSSGKQDGISSVNSSAEIGSSSYDQYLTAYNSGISSVMASAASSSLAGSRYKSIYDTGYEDGFRVGEQSDASGAIVGFVPTIIASIGGGLLYVGDHISVFGISLASVFGLLVLFAVGLWVFKIFKGSL